jgi:hypothetical protein
MRRFRLNRIEDVSGTSGTGIIAEGCEFSNGYVAVSWLGLYQRMFVWKNIDDCIYVNGYDGKTLVEWIDE